MPTASEIIHSANSAAIASLATQIEFLDKQNQQLLQHFRMIAETLGCTEKENPYDKLQDFMKLLNEQQKTANELTARLNDALSENASLKTQLEQASK